MKVVLLTGSRSASADDRKYIEKELREERPDLVLHGAARGVDKLALDYQAAGVPALWDEQKKAAGPIRNEVLVGMAVALKRGGHEVIVRAFPGPNSRGTWDCVRRAEKAELNVVVRMIGRL